MAGSPQQDSSFHPCANDSALGTLRLQGELSDVALVAALETNTALTTLQLHGNLSAAAGEALGAALKTNTAVSTLHFEGKPSAAAGELAVEFALEQALRQTMSPVAAQ